jgi:hypothetical protein
LFLVFPFKMYSIFNIKYAAQAMYASLSCWFHVKLIPFIGQFTESTTNVEVPLTKLHSGTQLYVYACSQFCIDFHTFCIVSFLLLYISQLFAHILPAGPGWSSHLIVIQLGLIQPPHHHHEHEHTLSIIIEEEWSKSRIDKLSHLRKG